MTTPNKEPSVLTPDFVLQNVIPVSSDGEFLCPICAFYEQEYCAPCVYVGKNKEETECFWEKTPNFDNKFFEMLYKYTPETMRITMEQAMVQYMEQTKIKELISQNLTPLKCNKFYPECYSCDLGEYKNLCNMLGCSCRNPQGKDFVNIVWKKKPYFASDFPRALDAYDKKAVSATVQLMLTKLIMKNKLKSVEYKSL